MAWNTFYNNNKLNIDNILVVFEAWLNWQSTRWLCTFIHWLGYGIYGKLLGEIDN